MEKCSSFNHCEDILNSLEIPVTLIYNRNDINSSYFYFYKQFRNLFISKNTITSNINYPSNCGKRNKFSLYLYNRLESSIESKGESNREGLEQIEEVISHVYDANTGLTKTNKDLFEYLTEVSKCNRAFLFDEFK
jgi:hypothetical protein